MSFFKYFWFCLGAQGVAIFVRHGDKFSEHLIFVYLA